MRKPRNNDGATEYATAAGQWLSFARARRLDPPEASQAITVPDPPPWGESPKRSYLKTEGCRPNGPEA